MNFLSIHFLAGVCITVILYYICPKKFQWYVLLASSCCFYLVEAGKRPFLVALLTIGLTYATALWIEKAEGDRKKRRFYLTAAVIVMVGLLVIFKSKRYVPMELNWLIIPLGVSYYTFSLIGYLADVYFKKSRAERNILKIVLYTLYFPKIMQGPISKFREIGPRLIEGHTFVYQRFCFGLQLILWGYFKKIVIADRAALLTETVFSDFASYSNGGAVLLVTTFIAVIRYYCDFSGYMDIVIGISQLMGIKLEDNFKQPFFSKSAAEFWRRWHITLGVWFKDYVYMPLVTNPRVSKISMWVKKYFGKRAGKSVLTIIPLACVWFLTGLWHGTGLSYMLWGVYWGTIIIISDLFAPELNKITRILHINTDAADWHLFQMLRTFCFFCGGLLLSTLVGYKHLKLYALTIVKSFDINSLLNGTIFSLGLDKANMAVLIIAIVVLWVVEIIQQREPVREKIAGLNAVSRWMIYAGAMIAVVLFGVYGPGYDTSEFIYTFF